MSTDFLNAGFGYVVCTSKEPRSDVGFFVETFIFMNPAQALSVATGYMEKVGGQFLVDNEELKADHVVFAWTSENQTVWVERLGIRTC